MLQAFLNCFTFFKFAMPSQKSDYIFIDCQKSSPDQTENYASQKNCPD